MSSFLKFKKEIKKYVNRFNSIEEKAEADIKVQILKNNYTIKGGGAVELKLAQAVKSEKFKKSINQIKSNELELEPHHPS